MMRRSTFPYVLTVTIFTLAVIWVLAEVNIVGTSLNVGAQALDCVITKVEMPESLRWFGKLAVNSIIPEKVEVEYLDYLNYFDGLHGYVN